MGKRKKLLAVDVDMRVNGTGKLYQCKVYSEADGATVIYENYKREVIFTEPRKDYDARMAIVPAPSDAPGIFKRVGIGRIVIPKDADSVRKDAAFAELVQDYMRYGVNKSPILVREIDTHFLLEGDARQLLAIQEAGIVTVNCLLVNKIPEGIESLRSLLAHPYLSLVDKGYVLQKLAAAGWFEKYTARYKEQIYEQLGISKVFYDLAVPVSKLPVEIHEMYLRGLLTNDAMSSIKLLYEYPYSQAAVKLMRLAVAERWGKFTVRGKAMQLKAVWRKVRHKRLSKRAVWAELERALSAPLDETVLNAPEKPQKVEKAEKPQKSERSEKLQKPEKAICANGAQESADTSERDADVASAGIDMSVLRHFGGTVTEESLLDLRDEHEINKFRAYAAYLKENKDKKRKDLYAFLYKHGLVNAWSTFGTYMQLAELPDEVHALLIQNRIKKQQGMDLWQLVAENVPADVITKVAVQLVSLNLPAHGWQNHPLILEAIEQNAEQRDLLKELDIVLSGKSEAVKDLNISDDGAMSDTSAVGAVEEAQDDAVQTQGCAAVVDEAVSVEQGQLAVLQVMSSYKNFIDKLPELMVACAECAATVTFQKTAVGFVLRIQNVQARLHRILNSVAVESVNKVIGTEDVVDLEVFYPLVIFYSGEPRKKALSQDEARDLALAVRYKRVKYLTEGMVQYNGVRYIMNADADFDATQSFLYEYLDIGGFKTEFLDKSEV